MSRIRAEITPFLIVASVSEISMWACALTGCSVSAHGVSPIWGPAVTRTRSPSGPQGSITIVSPSNSWTSLLSTCFARSFRSAIVCALRYL
jgi:hypothetical protein